MSIGHPVAYNPTLITTAATTVVSNKSGILVGILINTATTGTIQINDNATVIMQATGALTVSVPIFLACPATFRQNLTVTTTGTVSITVFWL